MLTKQYFSGQCVCGHSIRVHHSGMVVNTKFVEKNPWVKQQAYNIYDECLVCNGINGGPGLGDETGRFCHGYLDIEDPVYLSSIHPTD